MRHTTPPASPSPRVSRRRAVLGATLLLAGTLLTPVGQPAPSARAAAGWRHAVRRFGGDGWSGWTTDGVRMADGALALDADAATSAEDPYSAGGYRGGTFYNGAAFWRGTAVSPEVAPDGGFDELIPSWIASTPPGTWIEVTAQVRAGATWSPEYNLGVWSSGDTAVKRHSVRDQADDRAKVDTDTLVLRRPADAYRLGITLFAADPAASPSVRRAAAAAGLRGAGAPATSRPTSAGKELPVPERSQMVYPNGGPVWCSPTSTSMIMAYWGDVTGNPDLNRPVPSAAESTFDWVYRGHGNWPFNVAWAGSLGLDGLVTRLYSLDQVEAWVEAGVPVALSLAYETGQLDGSPMPRSGGHLLVVRGFTDGGDAIVNDPAANPNLGQSVRRVYKRAQLERIWLEHSGGAVYLIHPPGWAAPTADAFGAW